MKIPELLSRFLITTGALLAVGLPLFFFARTPLIHARMADNGGWTPDVIQAEAGKPLHLRFTSEDVTHGFAVGQKDMASLTIEPGKVTDITLTFDQPGTYTFFCTRWCGFNHWRMRGTIEVDGTGIVSESVPEPPLYATLGIDIDAPHDAPVIPEAQPSASRGARLAAGLEISKFVDPQFHRERSPYEVFEALGSTGLNDMEKWDVVAYIWQADTSPAALSNGRELYAQNCAACHGENGGGDGVYSDDLVAAGEASMQSMEGDMNMAMQAPADLRDARHMLGASPALLEGKILRGGMGTGMPMWGSIFTGDQIRDLIANIYSFQFEYQK